MFLYKFKMEPAYRLYYFMYGIYEEYLDTGYVDYLLILQNRQTAQAFLEICEMQLTAANLEFLLDRDVDQLNKLDLFQAHKNRVKRSNLEWQDWDDRKRYSIRALVAEIISNHKQVISIIDNYPKNCAQNICNLPGVQATSSEKTSEKILRNNAMELLRLNRAVREARQLHLNSYLIRARIIFDSVSTTSVVASKPLTYRMDVVNRYDSSIPMGLVYDIVLSNYNQLRLTGRRTIDSSFLREFKELSDTFIPSKSPSATTINEQVKSLYYEPNARFSRNTANNFPVRVIQTAIMCLLEKYYPDDLNRLLDQDKDFKASYELVKNFIEFVYSRLVSAYASGSLKSVLNLRYLRPDEVGEGKVGRAIRKLNNLLIFGPLLDTSSVPV